MKDRTLILVRHGDRDTSEGRERDNSLSAKGREQAKAIAKYYRQKFDETGALILSSPKVRCIETVLPLADKLGVEVKVLALLDEQQEAESQYQKRVVKFLRWWKLRAPALVVACSHGDWIPTFVQQALGTSVDLKKGGWLELGLCDGEVRLRWLLQKVPTL